MHLSDGDEVQVGDRIAKVLRDDMNVVKDITGGLPRVEEIFEARIPSSSAIVAGADGYVEFDKETRTPHLILYSSPLGDSLSVLLVDLSCWRSIPQQRVVINLSDSLAERA